MSLDNHKITTYQDNVSSLPDYPSDAGYTAKMLKEIFDGRTDKEIKQKFNALIDELKTIISDLEKADTGAAKTAKEYTDTAVSGHNTNAQAHSDIRSLISELTRRLNALADSDDTTLDQLSEIVEYIKDNRELIEVITTRKADADKVYNRSVIDTMLQELEEKIRRIVTSGGNGSGAILISVHDELYKEIIPEDGQMYVVKFHDMPYGEDPSLISPEVFYRLRIGDGVTPLCDIPNVSNIVAGTGNGSAILVDPTYDNGDDGLDAPKNIADAQYAVAFGKYLKNYGKAAAAFNYSNEITENGQRSFAVNMSNLIDAARAFASGYKNTVNGIGGGIYGGQGNIIEADAKNPARSHTGTIVGGVGNKLLGNAVRTILAGNHLISDTADQFVLGQYNAEDAEASLIIGAGTSEEDRRNALCIYKDGRIKLDGGNISDKVLEALCGIKNAVVPGTIAVDVYGNVTVNPSAGEETTQSYLMTRKEYGGYSDVTANALSEYTEYPAEGSGSERKWAWLGTVASKSYSNGSYAATGQRIILTTQEPDEWAAFKIKVDEDGEYALIGDTVHYSSGGRYEAYLLPMTDAIAAELAPDNAETYGELVSAEDGTDRVARINYKLFSELTSVAGAAPIGEAVDTCDAGYTEATTFNDKFGAVNIKAGEYVLILRAAERSNYNNMMFRNFHLKKFEPLTDAIKVGDTVLSEEELLAIKASAGAADFSGLVTEEELEAAIGGITPAGIGASPSGHTHTPASIGAAPSGHTHDDRYYTESEVDTKLAGKAASSHNQAASTITAGTFSATGVKAKSGTDYSTARVRNISAGTTDMTAGTSSLASGDIYFVYE